jgi:flagellar basal body-associated protein FliL
MTFSIGIVSFGEPSFITLAGNALVIFGVALIAYFSFFSKPADSEEEETPVEKKSYAAAAKTGATKKTPTKKTPSKKAVSDAVNSPLDDDGATRRSSRLRR